MFGTKLQDLEYDLACKKINKKSGRLSPVLRSWRSRAGGAVITVITSRGHNYELWLRLRYLTIFSKTWRSFIEKGHGWINPRKKVLNLKKENFRESNKTICE